MEMKIVPQAEVAALLPMTECIEVMTSVLETFARGEARLPLRSLMRLPDGSGLLGLMPGYLGSPECMGIKVVSVMPGNHGSEYDAHQGAVLLFEVEHGSLLAVIDASAITAIRTGAVSGAATRAMARAGAGDLAILGSGVQAASHLEAMQVARSLRRVRVWSRNAEHARAFAARQGARLGLDVETCVSARAAVEGADLICTTTAAPAPVLEGAWIAPGTHINAAGACFPTTRELDTAAVARAYVIVDARESAMNEAGDLLLPIQEGAFGPDHVRGELGDVFLRRVPGRTSDDEVTLFKSLGVALEDLAAAHHIWKKATSQGKSLGLEFGGRRVAHSDTRT